MSTKITSPIKGFAGRTVFGPIAVEFKDGVAETDAKLSDGLKAYLKGKGYKVGRGTTASNTPDTSTPEAFDPGKHTVEDVQAYLASLDGSDPEKHDAEVQRVVEAEKAGKNRSTLLEAIEGTPAPTGGEGQ